MYTEPSTVTDEQAARLFFDSNRMWRAQLNTVLAEYDITASAWSVIRVLRDEGQGKTQKELASELGIAHDAVSIKATTTEKLGFTGRGEGIAAQAVCLLMAD